LKTTTTDIFDELRNYKKKYYANELIKGIIFFVAILSTIYLLGTSLEFSFQLGIPGRAIIFFSFLLLSVWAIYRWILSPMLKLFYNKFQLSNEEAAIQIGKYFPDMDDKLLNTIQLCSKNAKPGGLLAASIAQRTKALSSFQFTKSIDIRKNRKYIKFALWPMAIMVSIFLFIPNFFTESTKRIVNFNEEFEPINLFSFSPLNDQFIAYKNEDFTVAFEISGNALPDRIYINSTRRKVKMKLKGNRVSHTFQKVQANFQFQIEATDYRSKSYEVKVYQRPDINNFNVNLDFPYYTGLANESLNNTGNIKIPIGTNVEWLISTIESEEVYFKFDKENETMTSQAIDNQLFTIKKRIYSKQEYTVSLKNKHSYNKDSIVYSIDVIPDHFPTMTFHTYQDTTLFAFIMFSGEVADDYGLTKLELVYKIDRDKDYSSNDIPISRSLKNQNYFYQWRLDSLKLRAGEQLEYFVRVWDNDAINGRKSTSSGTYKLKIPDKAEVKENIKRQAVSAEKKLDESLAKAKELNEQIEDIQNELKSKQQLDWQDQKRINELIEQKEKLKEELEKLSNQNKSLAEKQNKFNKPSERLKSKVEQLQKLMDSILDEETKALYKELQKLLRDQADTDQIEEAMSKIENKEENLEKEIERALELFKRLQFDYKMDEIINDLAVLEKEQKELSTETQDKENSLGDIAEAQQDLNEAFEEIEKDLSELDEMNEKLEDPEQLDSFDKEQKDVKEEQEKSQENLENKKRKKASESQQNASDKMKHMKEKMEQMQMNMEMTMLQENLDHLRDIVDNLMKVSFDQEQIMKDFHGVNQSDPRYIALSQDQLKLKDDAKIIEDSLLALAGRVFQIASFVTRELDAMNDNIESSLESLRDRRRSEAVSNQQYAMTSINNLALLLEDVLQQMQQQMADAMGKPQKGNKGKKQKLPGMAELQKELNKKIENLKKSGKSGRQLSQELAEIAAQQEMLRQRLQQLEEKLSDQNDGAGDGLKDVIDKMEKTELDLVNKNITQRTLLRQKDILTRLLKAENALRERELDDEREAEQATEYHRTYPPGFEEYLKAREKETDLLKSIPVQLSPYYKEEVNKYFRRLSEQ